MVSTSRTLKTRVAEHTGSCQTGAQLTSPPQSSIRSQAERGDVPVCEKYFSICVFSLHFFICIIDDRMVETFNVSVLDLYKYRKFKMAF